MEGAEDPFDVDAFDDESKKEKVHIRVQLRNGKRSVTHVSGLSPNLPLKKICKALKKELCCIGAVRNLRDEGDVITLQDDQREGIRRYLLQNGVCKDEDVIIHGF